MIITVNFSMKLYMFHSIILSCCHLLFCVGISNRSNRILIECAGLCDCRTCPGLWDAVVLHQCSKIMSYVDGRRDIFSIYLSLFFFFLGFDHSVSFSELSHPSCGILTRFASYQIMYFRLICLGYNDLCRLVALFHLVRIRFLFGRQPSKTSIETAFTAVK